MYVVFIDRQDLIDLFLQLLRQGHNSIGDYQMDKSLDGRLLARHGTQDVLR